MALMGDAGDRLVSAHSAPSGETTFASPRPYFGRRDSSPTDADSSGRMAGPLPFSCQPWREPPTAVRCCSWRPAPILRRMPVRRGMGSRSRLGELGRTGALVQETIREVGEIGEMSDEEILASCARPRQDFKAIMDTVRRC